MPMSEALREHHKPLRYFVPENEIPGAASKRHEKIRAAVITSFRDLIVEGVGTKRMMNGREQYVKGTLEHAVEQCRHGALAHYLDIALVIHDDTERDFAKLGKAFVKRPGKIDPWYFPTNLRNRAGELVTHITRNIPSDFRHVPLKDPAFAQERSDRKLAFETRVRRIMELHDVNVLISDHFLCRVQYLIDQRHFDLRNKVLNTHPGISDRRHRFRTPGNTPYLDAILRARGERGAVHTMTGASFHVIDEDIDTGPVLFDAERTPVLPEDQWEDVCARNYPLSKNLAFTEGVAHYAHAIYPRLGSISIDALEPYETDKPVYDSAA